MRGDVDHKGRVLLQGVIVTRYMSNRDFERDGLPRSRSGDIRDGQGWERRSIRLSGSAATARAGVDADGRSHAAPTARSRSD